MSFDKLGLEAKLLSAVEAKGYTKPSPIQQKAIPAILEGRDVLGGAQTGTGKTAAFTLPLLQLLNRNKRTSMHPRALILTPTRELATQVNESVLQYGQNLDLASTTVFGGVNFKPQIKQLQRGVDIVVACPGRLLGLEKEDHVDLSEIEILVLDEADRMLDMGFSYDLNRIINMLPKNRQTLLFSATYSKEIRALADRRLKNPIMVEVSPENKTVDKIVQLIHPVKKTQKWEKAMDSTVGQFCLGQYIFNYDSQ